MSEKKTVWTESQENAINTRGCTVLVSAAAGSGKTSTLTEKIIRMIIGDETHAPMSLERMLIVTFTRSAAADLRSKITSALTERLAADPSDAHLNKQLFLLPSADICTIDSFYEKPVRQNFEKLGLPASMRHASKEELDPICVQIMDGILDEKYRQCAEKTIPERDIGAFYEFADSVASPKDSSELAGKLIELHGKTSSLPDGCGRIRKCAERLERDAKSPVSETVCGKAVYRNMAKLLDYAISRYKEFLDCIGRNPEYLEAFGDAFRRELSCLESMKTAIGCGAHGRVAEYFAELKSKQLPRKTKISPYPEYDDVKAERRDLLDKIKDNIGDFKLTEDEIRAQFSKCAEISFAAAEILEEYDRRLAAEKKQRGVCTFDDMAHFMLALLENPDGTPTELAREYAEKYDIVCIDEYQDVNEIQDRIFRLIGGGRRFMVGDIKQSIYGFRQAEPGIFADYRRTLEQFDASKTEYPGGCGIFMSENFRCDENVIKFVNTVCDYTFNACRDAIGYTDADSLIFGKSKPHDGYISPKVQLDLIERSGDDEYIQANVTADRIAALLNSGRLANGERIKPTDIVILTRSKTGNDALIKALGERNVRVSADGADAVSGSPVTKYLISLLDVINNPHDDIALSETLTSEYFPHRINLGGLLEIRRAAVSSHSLYDAVCEFAERPGEIGAGCRSASACIERWRDLSVTSSADRLLRGLAADGGCSAIASTDEFTAVYDLACAYVRTSWNGLYGFLKFYHTAGFGGDANEFTQQEGCVSLITMHKSKGLQFPVCVLYNCGKKFNEEDARERLIFDKNIGVAVRQTDPATGEYGETFIRGAYKKLYSERLREEEMRILYVALTRAREYLLISGKLGKAYAEASEDARKARSGGDFRTYSANNYLSWILAAIRDADDSSFELTVHPDYDDEKKIACSPAAHESTVTESADDRTDAYSEILKAAPELTRNSLLLASVPVKAAASHLKPGMLESCFVSVAEKLDSTDADGKNPDMLEIDTPEFIKKRIELMRSASKGDFEALISVNRKPTAADRGTAIHKFLQFCDYARVGSCGVEKEIEYLLDRKFIDKRTADNINRWQANAFFRSDFYKLIESAENVRREFKFNLFLPLRDYIESGSKLLDLVGDRTVYIQGSIDLLLEMPDGKLILCDYKSDYIPKETEEDPNALLTLLKDAHGVQLEQYSKAIESAFGRKPDETYIYSTVLGKAIKL